MAVCVWTIGHSTRTLEAFFEALDAHGVVAIVDVRRFPASRRYPHFNEDALRLALNERGGEYYGMPALGGRRNPRPDSPNSAWRNKSFRGYADYMETPAFREAIDELLKIADGRATAMMCAETLWWRCHRALISDYLLARGVEVMHIRDASHSEPHRYSSPAHVVNGMLSYGPTQLELGAS